MNTFTERQKVVFYDEKYEKMQKKRQAINGTNYKMSLAHLKNSTLSHCVARFAGRFFAGY